MAEALVTGIPDYLLQRLLTLSFFNGFNEWKNLLADSLCSSCRFGSCSLREGAAKGSQNLVSENDCKVLLTLGSRM